MSTITITTPVNESVQIGRRKTLDRLPIVRTVAVEDGPKVHICAAEDGTFPLVDPSGIRDSNAPESVAEAFPRAIALVEFDNQPMRLGDVTHS